MAEREQDRVGALDHAADRVRVEHVALDDGQAVVAEVERGRGPGQGHDVVAGVEGLGDDVAAGPAGGAERANFMVERRVVNPGTCLGPSRVSVRVLPGNRFLPCPATPTATEARAPPDAPSGRSGASGPCRS